MSQLDALFFEKAALNRNAKCKKINLRGHNAAGTTSYETIWPVSSRYAQLTTAVALEIISSSASDASGGTGARTARVTLIDGNHVESSVDVTLNGTTAVAITGTFLAVNKIDVLTAGSGLTNAGTITVRTVSGSVAKCQIGAGHSMSNSFIYTTPADTISLLTMAEATINAAVTTTWEFAIGMSDTAGLFSLKARMAAANTNTVNPDRIILPFGKGMIFPEKTLIEGLVISGGAIDVFAMGELFVFNKASGGYLP